MKSCKSISNCLKKFLNSNPSPNAIWYGSFKYGSPGISECSCWKKVMEPKNNFKYFVHDFTDFNSDICAESYLVEVKIRSANFHKEVKNHKNEFSQGDKN